MKKWVLGTLALVLMAGMVRAESPGRTASATATVVMTGTLIDTLYAQEHKLELAEHAKALTKERALEPARAASGYALLTSNGELKKFTKASSAKIVRFLKRPESALAVEVTVKAGYKRKMALVSIRNRD